MHGLLSVAPVLLVSDVERSLSYYQNQLGFEVDFNYEGTYVGLVRDGCRLHLKGEASRERRQSVEAADHIDACFLVLDAPALASQFETAGATFSVPLRSSPYGKEFYVSDPDRNILAFVESVDERT